jgi:hypothetical protein
MELISGTRTRVLSKSERFICPKVVALLSAMVIKSCK